MRKYLGVFSCGVLCLAFLLVAASPFQQDLNPNPPDEVVKLIFIHHSTGENWLTDDYGNLGRSLDRNNYYVSDTNYGWGPDAIGDRTDIPNWTEWFSGEQTPTFMNALFNEDGQNSYYTRTISDPGGENRIVMFKSCFPNSDLSGNPNDSPGTYEELSVSGAKYVYNEILKYFKTRPDKLFIVITAPPLRDATNARNARAFNQWLVEDWLSENNYTLNNVAVFDFYNVLTDRNAHHRYNNGQIEHVVMNGNTLAYPSGDEHPSEQGSRKATEEFIPLLNIYYHRWAASAPETVDVTAPAPAQAPQSQSDEPPSAATAVVIDDFEGDSPAGTWGWEAFWDEATPTTIRCEPDTQQANNGSRSLTLDFDVYDNSWAICALMYENAQDWSSAQGLSFALRADPAGLIFDVDLYAGSHDDKETYVYTIESPPDSADGWVTFSLAWSDFHRASWEADADAEFNKPEQVVGLAFGANTYPDTPNTGQIWVDDLFLITSEASLANSAEDTEPAPSAEEKSQESRGFSLPCGSAFALPIAIICISWTRRKNKKI